MKIFQPGSKMDLFECCIYEEAIGHITGFTRNHTQGYYKLFDNLQRAGKMISNYKQ